MNETICIGILGKFFGHSFQRYLIQESSEFPYTTIEISGEESIEKLMEMYTDKYSIVCKRCGLKLP